MTRYLLRAAGLLTLLLVVGCGRGQVQLPATAPEDRDTRLGETTPIDLAAWQTKSRAELAKLAEELEQTIDKQRESFRHQNLDDQLLPTLRAPRSAPIFRKATFNATLGVSLPPYVNPGQSDPVVALHLARFGDREAALKLAGNDEQTRRAIAALAGTKNYPVEWSRLVGLALIAAQNRVTVGDVEGATDIALVHQQLAKLLDEKTAAGPLGAVLLPTGRRALAQASKAYRGPRWNKTALADDIDKVLAAWGTMPKPPSVRGMSQTQVEAALDAKATGNVVIASNLDRARDLLSLPLPTGAAQTVVVFLDDSKHVAEIAVAYPGKLDMLYPDADHLAYHLDEAGITGKELGNSHGLVKTAYLAGSDHIEIGRSNRSPGLEALVRINSGKAPANHGLRDFGPISLDRGFEANRLLWAPTRSGPLTTVDDKDALKSLVVGTNLPTPVLAVLQRDPNADLVLALRMTWTPDLNTHAAAKLLPALAIFGPAAIDSAEDASGAHLQLTWQDEKTRAVLRLPCDEKPPVLNIEDAQPDASKQARLLAASARDAQERQVRLSEGKPIIRLSRSPGLINDFSLENLSLGMSRAEAETALPRGQGYRLSSVPEGLSLLVLTKPETPVGEWAGQVLLRFEKDKLSEIRVRYQEGLAPAGKGKSLLDSLSDAKSGKPEVVSPTWTGLWDDLPNGSSKLMRYRWQDDRTIRTYQRDSGGSEVIWHDRGTEQKPWQFLNQGPKGILLGDTKSAVEAAFKPVANSGGAVVYRAPAKGPNELYMVWYKNGLVDRIVAVQRDPVGTQPKDVDLALKTAWGRNLDDLGTIRHKTPRKGALLGSYFWHDDTTRVQAFVQRADKGAQLLTEWRTWPVTGSKKTVKR